MSAPTYVIQTEHKPSTRNDPAPWVAKAIKILDGQTAHTAWGTSRDDAIANLRWRIQLGQDSNQVEQFMADADGYPFGKAGQP